MFDTTESILLFGTAKSCKCNLGRFEAISLSMSGYMFLVPVKDMSKVTPESASISKVKLDTALFQFPGRIRSFRIIHHGLVVPLCLLSNPKLIVFIFLIPP